MITHFVMLKMVDPADKIEAIERLRGMQGKIPDLLSIEVLGDSLDRDGAYDLVLRSTHRDESGLVGYLEDPLHHSVLAWLRPRLAARAIVDAIS